MNEEYIQVSTTTERKEDAEKIARALVERRLAACTQIVGPIESTYWWKGNVERAEEWLCTIKSSRSLYAQVEREISRLHPYQTPQIIATPIVCGSEDYLKWLSDELAQE